MLQTFGTKINVLQFKVLTLNYKYENNILLYLPTELKKAAKAKSKVPKTIFIFF